MKFYYMKIAIKIIIFITECHDKKTGSSEIMNQRLHK